MENNRSPEEMIAAARELSMRGPCAAREPDGMLKEVLDMAKMLDGPQGDDYYGLFFPGLTEDTGFFMDMPGILGDYVKHGKNIIGKYEKTGWEYPYAGVNGPTYLECSRIMGAALNAALHGDDYSKQFILHIYRTYFRNEYNMLKKFRTLSDDELLGILKTADDNSPVLFTRICIMTELMGIKTGDAAEAIKRRVNKIVRKEAEKYKVPEKPAKPDRDELATAFKETSGMKQTMEFKHLKDAAEAFMEFYEGREDVMEHLIGFGDADAVEWEEDRAFAAALMRKKYPDRGYTDTEIQAFGLLYRLCRAFSGETGFLKACMENLAGLESGPGTPPATRKWKNAPVPDKNVAEKAAVPAAGGMDEARKENEDLEDTLKASERECENLNSRALKAEKANDGLRKENRGLRQELAKARDELERLRSEHEELSRLRDFAYHAAEEDSIPKSHIPLSELEKGLMRANITIVGGRSNWVSRMSSKFPKWKFYSPSADTAMTETSLSGTEILFIFTGCISHASYYKAVAIAQRKGIPFRYLNTTNYERSIRLIHKEYSSLDGQSCR